MGKRIGRTVLVPDRVRTIGGQGFTFIPNRFLIDGFFRSLSSDELLLYFLLVLAGDRHGMSFYHYDTLCSLLKMSVDRYVLARNGLIAKDLLAFDGTSFQVLALPPEPAAAHRRLLRTPEDLESEDPATIHGLLDQSLKRGKR